MADVNIKITAKDQASPTIKAVSESLGSFGKHVGTVQEAVDALATGSIPGLSSSLSNLTRIISGSIGPWGLLGGAVAAAGGALITLGINAASSAEQLENMSAMTGLATADLESLQRISEDAGLGTENLATSIGNLNRQLASGEGGQFTKVLSALGGTIRDSSGGVKDAITVLDDLRERLIGIESPTLRAQLANAALGKGLRELIPLIVNSDKSLREQIETMKHTGRVMDELTHKEMLAFDKALDSTRAYFERYLGGIKLIIARLYEFVDVTNQAAAGTMSLRELVAAMPAAPPGPLGKSPLEIQAEQEARARAIASGATGKELELKLKIEDAENRMKAVHGEQQIAIAQEIAGYRQQLELLQKQTHELEKFRKKVEEINKELSKGFRGGPLTVAELGPPPVPLTAGMVTKEFTQEAEKGAKKWADFMEDATFRVGANQAKSMEKLTDQAVDATEDGIRRFYRMQARAHEENRRQWEKTIDTIREGAGQVFDAMLTKGQSVFSSLAKFAEGVLQTMLRNIFQNAIVALAQSSGILSRLLGPGGGGGGGGGGTAALAGGGLAAVGGFGGLGGLFRRGGGTAAGGYAQSGGITYATGTATKAGGFATGAAGSALMAGGALVGQMLAMDAFRRGSAVEGLAGGALAGASIGTMIAPGIGTAIGAGVGAIAGLITGLFGGGAKRRAEEAAKRAAMIEAGQFAAPETITRYGTWGGPGEYAVEPSLTGEIRGIGRVPSVVVNVENNMIDAKHAREAGEVIGQAVSQQILAGGSYLADNISWAAS